MIRMIIMMIKVTAIRHFLTIKFSGVQVCTGAALRVASKVPLIPPRVCLENTNAKNDARAQ